MKILGKILKTILKCVAVILCVAILCGLITVCVTASIIAVEVAHDQGGADYETLKVSLGERMRAFFIRQSDTELTPDQEKAFLIGELTDLRERQMATDEMLLAELNSGAYTFDQPMIVTNPYGISPLTAMLLFTTDEPENISIHVNGDSQLAEVDYTFDGYDIVHALPVYGLYPNRLNAVELTARNERGTERQTICEIQTDRLPDALSHETVRAHALNESAIQPGFTFTFTGKNNEANRAALDVNGVYRWCLDLKGSEKLFHYTGYCGNYNSGNSVFLSVGNSAYGPVAIVEVSLLGKLLNAWYAPYGAHHDIDVHDDCVWVTGSIDGDYRESLIYCLDRNTGELLKTLDLADVLQPYRDQLQHNEGSEVFYSYEDWCHMNSIAAHGDKLVLSCRNQSTVVCIDLDGNIQWMLADPTDYFSYFRQLIPEPVGDGFTHFYVQHAADVLPDQDGDPSTVDVLLFDNGDFRVDDSEKVSRMVQYRIDEADMTVSQVWSWGDGVTELYSRRHGDADLLENGNRLGSFEPHDEKADLCYAYGVEVDPEGNAVWECWRTSNEPRHDYDEYRLERLMIYADSANDLKLGVPANLFIPETETKETAQ